MVSVKVVEVVRRPVTFDVSGTLEFGGLQKPDRPATARYLFLLEVSESERPVCPAPPSCAAHKAERVDWLAATGL